MPIIPYAGRPLSRPDDERHALYLVEMRRQRRRRVWTALVVACGSTGLLVVALLIGFCGLGQPNRMFERPGSAQVVGNADGCWVFFEIERSVSGPGAMAGAPRHYAISQGAALFNESGIVSKVPIPVGPGWNQSNFNRNVTTVFGLDDGLYMLEEPSTLSRWDGMKFIPLPAGTRTNFAKLPALATATSYQATALLDGASHAHGWTPLSKSEVGFGATSFTWNGCNFVLDGDKMTPPAGLRLRRVDAGHEWTALLATYDSRSRPARNGE